MYTIRIKIYLALKKICLLTIYIIIGVTTRWGLKLCNVIFDESSALHHGIHSIGGTEQAVIHEDVLELSTERAQGSERA